MEETRKQELLGKLAKEMPDEAAKFIVWELGRLGELGETTAEELMDGTIDPKKVWKNITGKAKKELGNKSGAVSGFKVFKWLCEEIHIDGVITSADVARYVTEALENEDGEEEKTSESGNAAALDFDSLFN